MNGADTEREPKKPTKNKKQRRETKKQVGRANEENEIKTGEKGDHTTFAFTTATESDERIFGLCSNFFWNPFSRALEQQRGKGFNLRIEADPGSSE